MSTPLPPPLPVCPHWTTIGYWHWIGSWHWHCFVVEPNLPARLLADATSSPRRAPRRRDTHRDATGHDLTPQTHTDNSLTPQPASRRWCNMPPSRSRRSNAVIVTPGSRKTDVLNRRRSLTAWLISCPTSPPFSSTSVRQRPTSNQPPVAVAGGGRNCYSRATSSDTPRAQDADLSVARVACGPIRLVRCATKEGAWPPVMTVQAARAAAAREE